MSNNSVSIRSPLSCVRGLHANRCPGLMLTSYSWLAAIKSINENINTNFSASLSLYVRAAQRHRFPSGLCEWTGCSEPARSGSAQLVYRTGCAGTRRARGTPGERPGTWPPSKPSRNPELRASRDGEDEGRKCLLTEGLTHGHKNVSLPWGWAQPDSYNILLCFAVISLALLPCCEEFGDNK